MFSQEFCEIFKSTFFIEHLRWLLRKIAGRDSQNIDEVLHCSRLFVISENFWYISSVAKQKGESGAYHRKFSFFRKFDVLCFVETPVLRFALLKHVLRVYCNVSLNKIRNYNHELFCVRFKNRRKHSQHFKLLLFKMNLHFGASNQIST